MCTQSINRSLPSDRRNKKDHQCMYVLLYVSGRHEVLLEVLVACKSKKSSIVLAREVSKP